MSALLPIALQYLNAGLCVLPAKQDEKRPLVTSWTEFQKKLPTEEQMLQWFFDGGQKGACIITGAVSGNLEMIDFDGGGELFDAWAKIVDEEEPGLRDSLIIEKSQSGGKHVIYRSADAVQGNQKLAQRSIIAPSADPITYQGKQYIPRKSGERFEAVITLIETRGEGGLFLCSPTPGYEIEVGDLATPPTITAEHHALLLRAAQALNEVRAQAVTAPKPTPIATSADSDDRPGDDYGRRGDVAELLVKHGWRLTGGGEKNQRWLRPGKQKGWSATLKDRVFYVFSSNAAPFEPHKGYGPFGVYALLEHGGDYAKAARALRAEGFGSDSGGLNGVDLSEFHVTGSSEPASSQAVPAKPRPLIEIVSSIALSEESPQLRSVVIGGILREGEIANLVAAPKTGKSWAVHNLAVAMAVGGPWFGHHCVQGRTLIIDNELHPPTLRKRLLWISEQCGVNEETMRKNVDVLSLRGRLRDLYELRDQFSVIPHGTYSLIIIDSLYRALPPDIDENSNPDVTRLYNRLDEYAELTGAAFMVIHHTSKGAQGAKSVTDVGAGAGAQSRAADSHITMRSHEEDGAIVLDSVVRSFEPNVPSCWRRKTPCFYPATELDPTRLKRDRPTKKPKADTATKEKPKKLTAEEFVQTFVCEQPESSDVIESRAVSTGDISAREAKRLRKLAFEAGLIQEHAGRPGPGGDPVRYSRKHDSDLRNKESARAHSPPTPPVCA